MIELSHERIAQILHEETVKKEATDTILRAVYTRYMRLYERYFADIDALNEERIAGMREEHRETESLVRYYYMDLPQDVCKCLAAFDSEYMLQRAVLKEIVVLHPLLNVGKTEQSNKLHACRAIRRKESPEDDLTNGEFPASGFPF